MCYIRLYNCHIYNRVKVNLRIHVYTTTDDTKASNMSQIKCLNHVGLLILMSLCMCAIVLIYFLSSHLSERKDNVYSVSLCSHDVFRSHYRSQDYFPGVGVQDINLNDHRNAGVKPELCHFDPRFGGHANVADCLQTNLSIVTLGDSNGGRYHRALRQILDAIPGAECRTTRKERSLHDGVVPDTAYYKSKNQSWDRYLHVRYRYCRGCPSTTARCRVSGRNNPTSVIVRLEHLALTMILDDSLQLYVPLDGPRMERYKYRALTAAEFLLRYYLMERPPDLLVVFLPFDHVKNLPLAQSRADILYFHTMVRMYTSHDTKVFYMPSFGEFESRRADARFVNRTYEGRLATDQIRALNHILYEVIRDDLVRSDTNVFGFLDLWALSESQESSSIDGVHMQPAWYRTVMELFLQTYCNTV